MTTPGKEGGRRVRMDSMATVPPVEAPMARILWVVRLSADRGSAAPVWTRRETRTAEATLTRSRRSAAMSPAV